MKSRKKTILRNILRISICLVALWIVVQGVTLYDHIALKDGRSDVVGRVIDDGDPVLVQLGDAGVQSIPRNEIQTDEDGALSIEYGFLSAWSNSQKLFLLIALLIHFPVIFPQALRFRWMLAAQDITMGYWECLKLSFAGNFLNFATPLGSNAGDVFKAYFTSLHTKHKTEVVATVILDRVVGLVSLLIVVGLITTFCPADSQLAMFRPYILTAFVVGAVATIVYFSPVLRRNLLPQSLLSKIPMLAHLQRMDKAARTLISKPGTVLSAIMITIILQGLAMCAYCTVAMAMTLDAPLDRILEFFAYFYTGVVVQALPGPPQGLGTVELTYRYFFAAFGSPSQIVCMALAIRVIVLICALPGLLVTLTGSYKPSDVTNLDDTLDQVSDVESTLNDSKLSAEMTPSGS